MKYIFGLFVMMLSLGGHAFAYEEEIECSEGMIFDSDLGVCVDIEMEAPEVGQPEE